MTLLLAIVILALVLVLGLVVVGRVADAVFSPPPLQPQARQARPEHAPRVAAGAMPEVARVAADAGIGPKSVAIGGIARPGST